MRGLSRTRGRLDRSGLGNQRGRRRLSRRGAPTVWESQAAAKHGKIIEINAHPYRLDMDWRWWKQAQERGVKCAINPDAHSIADLQYLAVGIGVARKGWLTKADVINCLSTKEVEKLFGRSRLQ